MRERSSRTALQISSESTEVAPRSYLKASMVLAREMARAMANLARRAVEVPGAKGIRPLSGSTPSGGVGGPPGPGATASSKPYTIVVEGNIGSGKTTFLEKFLDRPSVVEVLPEPVDKWRSVHGHNLLDMMYGDPKRWSFLFQNYVQLTVLQQHSRVTDKPVKIMERSLLRRTRDPKEKFSSHFLTKLSITTSVFTYIITCVNNSM